MTLIKSKINSLGWLKSAICISVIGGTILSSKPVSAATLSFAESSENFSFNLRENVFGHDTSVYSFTGDYWTATFNVNERNAVFDDRLSINVLLLHVDDPHPGDSPFGTHFNLDFLVDTSTTTANQISSSDSNSVGHPGINHSDIAMGKLTANVSRNGEFNQITDWTLTVNGSHAVPEPTTILGTAMGLGLGGWLKRKNSMKENKTKSQG